MDSSPAPPDLALLVEELRRADATAERLGVEIVHVSAGQVVLGMTVTDADTNFLGMGHGGMMFTLADIAMSYVSNAVERSLATGATIEFLSAVHPGDVLQATAEIVNRRGRGSVVDCSVACDGQVVALFRGKTLAVK